MPSNLRWGSASHPGLIRAQNEDSVLAGPTVFAVADGMGGHAGGEIASAIAVAELAALRSTSVETVLDALDRTNDEILRRAAAGEGSEGMGSTIAGVVVGDRDAVVFNLGDSRVYRYRDNTLQQLTEDHSLVAEMVLDGALTSEEARVHPKRNVVTRALGIDDLVEPAITTVDRRAADVFLVASDGLFNEVDDAAMATILSRPISIERQARALLEAALSHGGRDNISVVLVAIGDATEAPARDDDLLSDTNPNGPNRPQPVA